MSGKSEPLHCVSERMLNTVLFSAALHEIVMLESENLFEIADSL